jgi:AcrR family transcriptional regulator
MTFRRAPSEQTGRTVTEAAPTVRLPAARRRKQLLEVALQVFAERGFHPTSMNDLAEAAGVTKPVLYQHFGSKRELYLELLDDVGSRLRDAIGKATSEAATPREQVERGVAAYFSFVDEHQAAFQVLFGGGSRRDEEFAAYARQVEDSIAETVAALIDVPGLDDDSRRLLAHGVVGLAEGASRHWLRHGTTGDPHEQARRVAELAWAGLRGISS